VILKRFNKSVGLLRSASTYPLHSCIDGRFGGLSCAKGDLPRCISSSGVYRKAIVVGRYSFPIVLVSHRLYVRLFESSEYKADVGIIQQIDGGFCDALLWATGSRKCVA
jgi:hypothetical protein